MKTYAILDTAILNALPAHVLNYVKAVNIEADRLATAQCRESFRVIDGRIQALRKAGKIKFNSKTGWALVEAIA